jgi:hypothetical protein
MLCNHVGGCQRFGGTFHLYLHGRWKYAFLWNVDNHLQDNNIGKMLASHRLQGYKFVSLFVESYLHRLWPPNAFWDMGPYSLIEVYRRFRGAYWLHHQWFHGFGDGGSTHLRETSVCFNETVSQKPVIFAIHILTAGRTSELMWLLLTFNSYCLCSTVFGYGLDERCSIPEETYIFSFRWIQTDSGINPASYPIGFQE